MSKVKILTEKEVKSTVSQEIGKEHRDPQRKLKLCTYEKRKDDYWRRVVVDIQGQEFQICDHKVEESARNYFYSCYDVIPCFWSPRDLSHLTDIFTVKVLTKLAELIEQYNITWSVAHMCVSLPLPEETMIVLLTSDSFKEHFTSTHHPKGYTLLHLAIEQNSVSTCKVIMQCGDHLGKDPDILVKDNEKLQPFQLAINLNAKECVAFLKQSQSQNNSKSYCNLLEQFQKAVENKQINKVMKLIEVDPNLKLVNEPFPDGCSGLHKACDHQMIKCLLDRKADPSARNLEYDTPLHTIIKQQAFNGASSQKAGAKIAKYWKESSQKRVNCIIALLAYGRCDPSCQNREGMTPLHLAVEACDLSSVKALLIFGADISLVNKQNKTPMDLAIENSYVPIIQLLQFAGDNNTLLNSCISNAEYTNQPSLKGDRVLCLDGGGIKGLVLIEMLMAIEQITGKRIRELFDWIIGTSTGGILALAMVYTHLSLHELRCRYFGLKDNVLHKVGNIFPHCSTEALEKFLQDAVGDQRKLGEKLHPKVLITATDIEEHPPKLVFFNNFEEDSELGKDQHVWKAARATSAAPIYFKHFGRYIDGGIKANNPTVDGMTEIHKYYKGNSYKLACVVSLGCGSFQKKMKHTDVHDCWSKITGIKGAIKSAVAMIPSAVHLFDMLIHEVSESNGRPVDNARAFCETKGTPFYRLSPKLDMAVDLAEQNTETLVDMVTTARRYIMEQLDQLLDIKKHTLIC